MKYFQVLGIAEIFKIYLKINLIKHIIIKTPQFLNNSTIKLFKTKEKFL